MPGVTAARPLSDGPYIACLHPRFVAGHVGLVR